MPTLEQATTSQIVLPAAYAATTDLVTKGRPPSPPLAAGESCTGPFQHANGDYYVICTGGSLGRRQVSCRTTDPGKAEKAAERFREGFKIIDVADVLIGPILDAVLASPQASKRDLSFVKALKAFWGERTIGDITPDLCKAFVAACRRLPKPAKRPKLSTLRFRMGRLFAWIRQAIAAVDPTHKIETWFPPEGETRKRWLRRQEAARLLWATRGRIWDKSTGSYLVDANGRRVLRPRGTIERRRMMGRLILLGLYTGTRADAMYQCRWSAAHGVGYVNLRIAVFYRQGPGPKAAIKRQPKVRLIPQLVRYLKGWQRRDRANPAWVASGDERVIHNGTGGLLDKANIRRHWNPLREDAGLGTEVTRHTLRHTAATWLLEGECPDTDVAAFLGITLAKLHKTYAQVDSAFAQLAVSCFDLAILDRRGRSERIAAAAEARCS